MMDFEKIKKEFIVDEEEYSREKLSSLMITLSSFCKITKDGQVIILQAVPTRKILKLIICARFVAHEVNKEIDQFVTKQDLRVYSSLKDNVFIARFNEMLKENFAEKKGETFKVKNILFVEKFLNELINGKKEKK